jgi:hypothetical protein
MEKMCLLVKRMDTGVVTFKPSQRYFVGTLRGFMKLPERDRANYVLLAKHHDREVLNKMKKLAIEGDLEREN